MFIICIFTQGSRNKCCIVDGKGTKLYTKALTYFTVTPVSTFVQVSVEKKSGSKFYVGEKTNSAYVTYVVISVFNIVCCSGTRSKKKQKNLFLLRLECCLLRRTHGLPSTSRTPSATCSRRHLRWCWR